MNSVSGGGLESAHLMTTLGGFGLGGKDGIPRKYSSRAVGFTSHAFSRLQPSLPITRHRHLTSYCDSDTHLAPLAAAYITTAFRGEVSGPEPVPSLRKQQLLTLAVLIMCQALFYVV